MSALICGSKCPILIKELQLRLSLSEEKSLSPHWPIMLQQIKSSAPLLPPPASLYVKFTPDLLRGLIWVSRWDLTTISPLVTASSSHLAQGQLKLTDNYHQNKAWPPQSVWAVLPHSQVPRCHNPHYSSSLSWPAAACRQWPFLNLSFPPLPSLPTSQLYSRHHHISNLLHQN